MKNISQAYRPSYLWFWPPLILGGSVISAGTIHDLRQVKVAGTGPLCNPCVKHYSPSPNPHHYGNAVLILYRHRRHFNIFFTKLKKKFVTYNVLLKLQSSRKSGWSDNFMCSRSPNVWLKFHCILKCFLIGIGYDQCKSKG